MNIKLVGHCLCGCIQFSVVPKNLDVHACHCGMCRRWAGCASMVIELQEPAEVTKGKDDLVVFKSSDWGERCFCAKCGTNLFFNAPDYKYFGVCPGALKEEDQAKMSLTKEVFIDSKPDYYEFAGERVRVTEAELLKRLAEAGEDKNNEGEKTSS